MADLLDRRALSDVLRTRGIALQPEDFIEIIEEVSGDDDTLTAGEGAFLAEAGVDRELLSAERVTKAQTWLTVATARADASANRGLTTGQVAELTRAAAANVRRAVAHGDLYVAGRSRSREHVFPAWQFAEGRPLPHLHQVLDALPGDLHPLDVEAFMTTPLDEPLGGRSPAEWLATGGEPTPIVRLADELGRL